MKAYPKVPKDPVRLLLWRAVRSNHYEFHGGRPWTCHEGLCAEARALGKDLVAPDADDIEMMRFEKEWDL